MCGLVKRYAKRGGKRKGSIVLEFSLTAIPLLFVVISLTWASMGMWQYHTLAEAVNATARIAAVHGAGCAGQTCATTAGQLAQTFAARAIGLPPDQVNVTLTSSASTISCNPLSSCYSNSSAWPSLAGNSAGTTDITIQATLQISTPISLWTPGRGARQISPLTLGARSREPVVF